MTKKRTDVVWNIHTHTTDVKGRRVIDHNVNVAYVRFTVVAMERRTEDTFVLICRNNNQFTVPYRTELEVGEE